MRVVVYTWMRTPDVWPLAKTMLLTVPGLTIWLSQKHAPDWADLVEGWAEYTPDVTYPVWLSPWSTSTPLIEQIWLRGEQSTPLMLPTLSDYPPGPQARPWLSRSGWGVSRERGLRAWYSPTLRGRSRWIRWPGPWRHPRWTFWKQKW